MKIFLLKKNKFVFYWMFTDESKMLWWDMENL